jgi:hypothetical protein
MTERSPSSMHEPTLTCCTMMCSLKQIAMGDLV